MINRFFRQHPRLVGEGYRQHWVTATRFGLMLIAGGLAALVHGLVPAWFERTGSDIVRRLHTDMERRRDRAGGRRVDDQDGG